MQQTKGECRQTHSSSRNCLAPAFSPTASSSSMKMTQGAFFLASANSSRTRAAPRPTNSSTNSLAEAAKKGTPASPATALAAVANENPSGQSFCTVMQNGDSLAEAAKKGTPASPATALAARANNNPSAQSHQSISTVTCQYDQDVGYRAADLLLAVALLGIALAAMPSNNPSAQADLSMMYDVVYRAADWLVAVALMSTALAAMPNDRSSAQARVRMMQD